MPSTTGSSRTASSCPTPRWILADPAEGTRRPLPCGRLVCGICGPIATLRTVSAIEMAKPTRSGVLTMPSHDDGATVVARELRAVMRSMVQALRREGLAWEHVHVVEVSPEGRPHIHFLQRGADIQPNVLLQVARAHGAGWSAIQPIHNPKPIARYVLKAPLAALDVPILEAASLMLDHVLLNGGRLAGHTRGFWIDASGRVLGGSAKARRAAADAWKFGLRP